MNLPDFIRTLRARGYSESAITKIVYDNPLAFFSQSRCFNMKAC